jgi:hypothetical protein
MYSDVPYFIIHLSSLKKPLILRLLIFLGFNNVSLYILMVDGLLPADSIDGSQRLN